MVIGNSGNGPLRVALVTRSLMTGGTQRHIVKLCQTASPAEVAISLFLLVRDEPNDLISELPPDVRVFTSPYRRHHPRVLKWLADGLRETGAQVAHSFLWTADALAGLSGMFSGRVPLIGSERGDRTREVYARAKNIYDRLITFRAADCFCANSDYGRDLLARAGCDPAKLRTIRNGVDLKRVDSIEPIDLRRLLGWPEACRVVGTVSRLIWYKGVDVLIRAMAGLRSDPAVHCVVVGDGPQRAELEKLARDLGVADRVAFLGRRWPAEAMIKDFDVAVLSSLTNTEHCSNSLLEYMACRKPVVATRVGGNPELVTPGESGLLVEPNDAAGLSRAIQHLLQDRALGGQMAERGRERIEREFQMQTVTARYIDLWREVACW